MPTTFELTTYSRAYPFKTPLNTSQDPRTASSLFWFQKIFHQVTCKILWQLRKWYTDPTSNQNAQMIGKVLNIIQSQHVYLPRTIISHKKSAAVFELFRGLIDLQGTTVEQSTTKHAQPNPMLLGAHVSIKKTLKTENGEWRSMWHTYVDLAVLEIQLIVPHKNWLLTFESVPRTLSVQTLEFDGWHSSTITIHHDLKINTRLFS